jgi:acyl-CoA synthetase (AMP-forming)/AMP-acid ligase II
MIETVPALLRAAAKKWRDKTALKSMREPPASFGMLDTEADRFAKALIADGMKPNERFGIWAPNMWEWVAAAVGAQRVGATLVPLNSRLRGAEVADIARRAGIRQLVTARESQGSNYPVMLRREDIPELRRVIVLHADSTKLGGTELSWDSFLAIGDGVAEEDLRARECAVTGDTVADILFTSGTTGRPKGAVFTHRRTVLTGYGMSRFASMTETDCNCPLGPFAHLAGYKGGWVNGLITGATVCWADAHDRQSVLDAIATMRVTVMPAPPIIWQDILDHPNRADWDTSSLRFAATGSTMIPPRIVQRLMTEMKVTQVGTGYGLTESGGMTNFTRPEDTVDQVAFTSGRPAPDADIRIVGPEGKALSANEAGEILVRTERAMQGYMDDPEATCEALDDDGWLHTGDVGSVDEYGYLRITDRLKDMYITNGFNVYPSEVEKLMSTMPDIAQCAVIGVPESRKGEVGHAFLVRKRGSTIAASEVLTWCKQNIASYKIPAGVTFVEDLPRNSLGKVLKRELRTLI